ncbi:hypothetical protein SeMB42_g05153 [Synchytrium endobioticum]|uniref:SWIRM domain-containing protein n=1 Tax=Synchytrium endobioticum TaxID=286115 RepID=A0A507CTM9_9FUNG|nr:hypothetical protein SeMB42_g05153 [Synchytrium endobioticum]
MSSAYWDSVYLALSQSIERADCEAAYAARLHPDQLSPLEKRLFPAYSNDASSMQKCYLYCRNRVLRLFIEISLEWLTFEKAKETMPFLPASMVLDAYNFCFRKRLINFGLMNFAPEQPRPSATPRRRPKVLIIGAGMAGLSTAMELNTLFHLHPDIAPEVHILEGRKRTGGRIYTFPLNSRPMDSLGRPDYQPAGVDLAAQIVTGFGRGNPLAVIMRNQLKLPLHYTRSRGPSDCPLFDADGSVVADEVDDSVNSLFNLCLERACQTIINEQGQPVRIHDGRGVIRATQKKVHAPSLGKMIDYYLKAHPRYLELKPVEHRLFGWHCANLEFANATTLDSLSLHHWDQDDDHSFSGLHAMVKGGFCQLPNAYAERLQGQIHMDKTVSRVSWRANSMVQVSCTDGSTYEADAVVVTIPLGPLKQNTVQFDPPLEQVAPMKAQAINNLGFGLFNKVVMVFPRVFWRKDIDSFGYLNEAEIPENIAKGSKDFDEKFGIEARAYAKSRGICFLFWNLISTCRMPVLVAFIAGEAAREFEECSDQVILEKTLSILSVMHPYERTIPNPVETIITRWSKDPYTRGSYSYIPNGATGDDYDHLAETIDNKIFWAGEATNRQYPATVPGAMLTGMRVATSIADRVLGDVVPAWKSSEKKSQAGTVMSCTRNDCGVVIPRNESIFSHLAAAHPVPTTDTPKTQYRDGSHNSRHTRPNR